VKPRFLADADFNHRIVNGIRRREPTVDFQTAVAGGTIGLSDPDVLALAARVGRILVTHDRDTMLRHFARFVETETSPRVTVVREQLDIGRAIEDLLLIWAASDVDEWLNKAGYVPI
jgi:predicted nuclease of predicted toxin-antitoxin system